MPVCRYCGKPFAWGNAGDKWVPLVPLGEEEDLDRDYQDENGALRASHVQLCANRGGPSVRVSKLARNIPAEDIIGPPKPKIKRGRKPKTYEG
jgi:hypothetical protein